MTVVAAVRMVDILTIIIMSCIFQSVGNGIEATYDKRFMQWKITLCVNEYRTDTVC